jgi:MFS family permease
MNAVRGTTSGGHEPSAEVVSLGLDSRRRVALAVILSGIFVTVMDSSIVNVAIPVIRSTLHASFGEAELTIASYALAFSAGMITGGRLGDIYGQRRVFVVAFAAFTLTSFVCGVAPNIEVLIAGRLLQGASAAMLSPQVFALVRMSFADGGERRAAFSAMGVAIGLANVAGLVLGGVLIQADLFGLAWRMVFLVNLPIGIAAIFLTPLVLADMRSGERKRLDLAGVGLSTLAMLLLMLPLVEGPERGWAGWPIAMLVASPVAFVGFYLHQRWKSRRGLSPLLETDLFGDRAFNVGALLILFFWGSTTGVRLIQRSTRTLSLTMEGQSYYERVAPLLRAIEDAEDVVQSATAQGPIRVSAPQELGRMLIAPWAATFLDRHSDVSLDLGISDRFVDIIREGFDIAIRMGSWPTAISSAARSAISASCSRHHRTTSHKQRSRRS